MGTTTKASSRAPPVAANPAAHAALLAAAAVAQSFVATRRMTAPLQPAAAAAAALSAATAIPLPTAVQQRLEQLQARRRRDRPDRPEPPDDHHPDDDRDDGHGPAGETPDERRARRRRTRWLGSEHDKTFIPGLPTMLPSTLTRDQEEQYLCEYPGPTDARPATLTDAAAGRLTLLCSAAPDRGGEPQAALRRPRHPGLRGGEVCCCCPRYSCTQRPIRAPRTYSR